MNTIGSRVTFRGGGGSILERIMSGGKTICTLPESILKAEGYDLEAFDAPKPQAVYLPAVKIANTLYMAGHVPYKFETLEMYTGKVGVEYTVQEAQKVSEIVAVSLLKTIKNTIGSLDLVERIIKVNGFVNCDPNFVQISQVINGASELLVKVFGLERGAHARTAIGTSSLPFNVPVEIDMIVQLKDSSSTL